MFLEKCREFRNRRLSRHLHSNLKIEEEREDVVMSSAVVPPSIQQVMFRIVRFSDGAVFWQPDGSAGIHREEDALSSSYL